MHNEVSSSSSSSSPYVSAFVWPASCAAVSWPASCSSFEDRVSDVIKCLYPYIAPGGLAFPCGGCGPCRLNRRRIWTHRIMLEAMQHADNSFCTLTYAENPEGGSLDPAHVRDWLKRFRFRVAPVRIRYFVVGEYGDETERPHYHAALFGWPCCVGGPVVKGECKCSPCSVVRETWGFGHIMLGSLEPRSAQYIAGYTTKKLRAPRYAVAGRYPEFARMSLKPGIGADAIPDVASVMMQYRLEENGHDVPTALRHGKDVMPLGRYLRKRLRLQVGLDEKAPPEYLEALRQGLLPVFEAARAVAPHFVAATVRAAIGEANEQPARNACARSTMRRKL